MKKVMNLKESKKEHTYGRVCREEREERGDTIIFSKMGKKKKNHDFNDFQSIMAHPNFLPNC